MNTLSPDSNPFLDVEGLARLNALALDMRWTWNCLLYTSDAADE